MEKEPQPDSMATITMKPEYPPSEVYSTSEPPPAYRQRESSAVQIARIAGLTVVAAAFILGAFIFASSWVSARNSCHQHEQLDAILDELAYEGRAYGNDGLLAGEPLPVSNAHALHGAPPASNAEPTTPPPAVHQPSPPSPAPAANQLKDSLNHAESKIDEDKLQKIDDVDDSPNADSEESSDSDSSAEDEEELDAVRPLIKMPIHFDLDEIAGAFLANNQKGRMNCVVERRQEDPMERRFPFNILGAFAPRAAHAERVAIICHGGDEPRPLNFPDPQSQVFAFPLTGPVRLPIRPQPDRSAPAGMAPPAPGPEPRMPPFAPPMMSHRNAPFPLPLPWESSEEQMPQMSGPGPMPREMRIHVQRVIAIPSPHNMPPPPEAMGPFPPPPPPAHPRDQNEQPSVIHQFIPQSAPTQEMERHEVPKIHMEGSPVQMNLPWGLTPEDIGMIHRTAEDAVASQRREQQSQQNMDNDMQEVKTIVNTLVAAEAEEQQRQAEEQQRQADDMQHQEDQDERRQEDAVPMQLVPAVQSARMPRTLLLPQEMPMEERPHYVQPRSVRSVDGLLHRQKRIKRCACDCGF